MKKSFAHRVFPNEMRYVAAEHFAIWPWSNLVWRGKNRQTSSRIWVYIILRYQAVALLGKWKPNGNDEARRVHHRCGKTFQLPGWNSVSSMPVVNNYHSFPRGTFWSLQIFIGASPKLSRSGHVDTLGGTMDEACWEVEGKVWKIRKTWWILWKMWVAKRGATQHQPTS